MFFLHAMPITHVQRFVAISTDKNIKNTEFHSTGSYEMAVELRTPAEIEDHLKALKIPLLDLPDSVSPVPRKAVAKKTPTPVAAPKVLSEEDWEM